MSLVQVQAPDPEIKSLADQATMTDKARQIFYGTNPKIDTDRDQFNVDCQAPISSNTVELGCYTSDNRIYILNIDNSKLSSQMVVTAAHEMLHAAYENLSDNQKQNIDSEIESELPKIQNRNLSQELQEYRLTEPGQRENELHSILETEYAALGPDLESYYSQYFSNRQAIVDDSNQFKYAFNQLNNQLISLKSQIQQIRIEMRQDLRAQDISSYNNLVPKINSLVNNYNQTVGSYNSLSRSLQGEEQPASSS